MMANRKLAIHYPTLNVGDQVRVKQKLGSKPSEESRWGDVVHVVTSVHHGDGGTLYDLDNTGRQFLRSEILRIEGPREKKPSRLPNVGRPLHLRLTPRQESQRGQFEEYVPQALRILGPNPMGLAELGGLLQLPPEVKVGGWVRLYPEIFEITARAATARPEYQEEKFKAPPEENATTAQAGQEVQRLRENFAKRS